MYSQSGLSHGCIQSCCGAALALQSDTAPLHLRWPCREHMGADDVIHLVGAVCHVKLWLVLIHLASIGNTKPGRYIAVILSV